LKFQEILQAPKFLTCVTHFHDYVYDTAEQTSILSSVHYQLLFRTV